MCFGSEKTTGTKTSTVTQPGFISDASKKSVESAYKILNKPFTAYTGDLTAGLTPDQDSAFSMIRSIAGSENPYLSDIEGLYKKFANAGPQTVSAPSLLGSGVDASKASIQDYMNPYISGVLDPTLREFDRSWQKQQQSINAGATMAGAFGDARHGVSESAALRDSQQQRTDAVNKAYSDAFGAASGLRAQDVANLISTGTTNAGLAETALQRAITGGTALQGLDQYQTGRSVDLAKTLADAGKTQQDTKQADLSAKYQEFLRGQGWDEQQASTFAKILAMQPNQSTTTTTESKPDNTGYQLLGTILGAFL
jgi:hypothetical protein